ncbi:unnamed protein product [Rotaria socialis]|uniref:Uncharacterized protein n=2 Tax=Rotaria socialis TaxID=392032 RepID=A0A818ITP4_9BILA|nr:unnamed protein product [Rotaria socialis]CAF3525343.1 unnamed protein product [Rotaria socialis]CAF3567268.1 unnamed protein product [Rotaria socialis]CAF4205613.1 unnamed protein product [Rotaria socialis]CAF4353422.1 unnamed protein product [Rotaria socialis]
MSVLLVSDDVNDDIRNYSIVNQHEHIYKQLKELEYDLSSSVRSFSIVEHSLSIFGKSNKYYRQHRRRRRCRPQQQCLVQHLLTYMLTLLILTNHLHWPVILLSLSSIKIMSTQASTITTANILSSSTSPNQTISKRPSSAPSTTKLSYKKGEHQCLPINTIRIDRICSKVCRARKTPFEDYDNISLILADTYYLPFCLNILNETLVKENFFTEAAENECRQILTQIKASDDEAKKAYTEFVTYMEAIDSRSVENRYSIINADCEAAYQTWTCSVKIPYYYRNQRIPPCQTICDEVERVCPTFRPSDREPLFAGQPLFFCDGSIVTNSDYGQRPHCFDSCHLSNGSLRRPPISSSPSILPIFAEKIVTTPPCFEIELLLPSSSSPSAQIISSSLILDDVSIFNNISNTSLSATAITIISSSWSSIILTFIFVFQWNYDDD